MAAAKRKAKKKQTMTPEQKKRKKRIAVARLKLLTLLLLTGGCIYGVYLYSISTEPPPLVLDSSGYTYETAYAPEAITTVTDSEGNIISADETFEEEAIAVFQPKIPESFPPDMEMNIYSPYALVYDATDNAMLYAKDAEAKLFPASTTKILTAAVVLDSVPPDYEFTAGDELDFVSPDSSLAYVNKGNILDTGMLIDALMLPSGNDAAYVAAANCGRVIADNENLSPREAVDEFISAMNRTAGRIGAENTHFTNPDGYHDDNHYTTLIDMLKITLYAKDIPALAESAEKENVFCTYLSGESVSWENSNLLLHDYSDVYYMYATGLKTGMTDQSGYCVVATAERFGHEIICMVYGSQASDIRWNDAVALMDRAFVHIRNKNDGV